MNRRGGRGRFGARSTFFTVLALLLLLRALLPFALTAYVQRQLDSIPAYELELGDLDLNLWRGAYELEGVRLFKERRGPSSQPFFEAARIDLSLHWGALLSGAVVGTAVLHRPALRFVVDDDERQSQTGAGVSWKERLDALFPFRIDRFAVRDGEIHYERRAGNEVVDCYVTDFYLEARNLTNIRDTERVLDVEVEAAGRPLGTGELEAYAVFAPLHEEVPRMELNVEVREVDLGELNDFAQAYAAVDVESGTLALYTELAIRGQSFEGYLKTFLEDVRVLSFREIDDPGDALEAVWEGLVGVAVELLENQPHDRLASRIPFSGRFQSVNFDLFEMVGSLLSNAFIRALRPVLDDSIQLRDIPLASTRSRGKGRSSG